MSIVVVVGAEILRMKGLVRGLCGLGAPAVCAQCIFEATKQRTKRRDRKDFRQYC